MSKDELKEIESLIVKKKAEVEKYEKMLLTGNVDEPDPELLEKINVLVSLLEKYEKFLKKSYGDFEGSSASRTTEILEKLAEIYQKKKKLYGKYSAALEESEAEFLKAKKRLKERNAQRKQQEEASEEYNASVKRLRIKKRKCTKLRQYIEPFALDFGKLSARFDKNFKPLSGNIRNEMTNCVEKQNNERSRCEEKIDEAISGLVNKYDQQKAANLEEIEELKKKIEKAKQQLASRDSASEEQRRRYEENKRRQEEVNKINQRKDGILTGLAALRSKWNTKVGEIDFSNVTQKLENKTEFLTQKLPEKIQFLKENPQKFAKREPVGEIYQKATFVTIQPPGIKEYIEKRKKVLSMCQDKGEIKYFLMGEKKLIELYLRKKKQRDDTLSKKQSEKGRLDLQYNTNHTTLQANLNRNLKQKGLPPETLSK